MSILSWMCSCAHSLALQRLSASGEEVKILEKDEMEERREGEGERGGERRRGMGEEEGEERRKREREGG
ncbi:hypothetical protein Tco_0692241 [Tanacetum coccineum]